MTITDATLKDALGKEFKSGREYVVIRHSAVLEYLQRGYTRDGEVQDTTGDPNSTMVVMGRKPQ